MDCSSQALLAMTVIEFYQNFKFANALTPMPGISTSSLLYDTELRMFSFSRLLPTTPTIISRAPNQLASSFVL